MFAQKLQTFLATRNANKLIEKSKMKLNLQQIKIDLSNAHKMLENLKEQSNLMQTEISTNLDYTHQIVEIERQKMEIQKCLNFYERPEIRIKIKQCIKQRQAKRQRMKRNKEKTAQNIDRKQIEKHRKFLHDRIDRWQRDQIANEMKRKQNQRTIEKVPQIFGNVLKKKSEAKRYIALIDSMIELRRVRKIQAGKNDLGEKHFVTEMNKLKAVWSDALLTYKDNELELKKNFIESENLSVDRAWMQVLFGVDEKQNGPVDGFQYAANDFIEIR